MFLTYGGYRHLDNEARLMSFIVRPGMTPRGKRATTIYEMHVQLEINLPVSMAGATTAQAQSYLNGRINEIVDVYSYNYQDVKFCHDDETPTRHSLINSESLSGVRVTHRTWPKGDGDEYATTRTGYVVFQAEYLTPDSQLVIFQEVVRNIGTGGPRWRVQELEQGNPIVIPLNQRTAQRVLQSGVSVGLQGYVLDYMIPLWPAFEHLDLREVTPATPRANGQGYTHFPLSWTFHMTLPAAANNFPNIV
jgi:hypothetical protein